MVPLGDGTLYLDLFERWRLPVVLCASTALGTINHSLLSIEALRRRQISILGIAFIGEPNADAENAICEIGGVPWLGRLPMLSPLTSKGLKVAFKSAFPPRRFEAMTQRKTSPIWHPFTQHAFENRMSKTVRGDGGLYSYRRASPYHRCNLVLVGRDSRALPSTYRPRHSGAGRHARLGYLRRLYARSR